MEDGDEMRFVAVDRCLFVDVVVMETVRVSWPMIDDLGLIADPESDFSSVF